MDSEVVVATGGSFGFPGGLVELPQAAWVATVSAFTHGQPCSAGNVDTCPSRSRADFTSFSVPLLAC